MCQSKVLVVLDIHLIFAIFLKIVFGTDSQRRVKDPVLERSYINLFKLLLFLQK